MQFFFNLLLLASSALAASVHFINQDSTKRTIVFTPNAGLADIPNLVLEGDKTAVVNFPHGWIGNWFSVSQGAPMVPGMLGEVSFNSWGDLTFYDVSAIVNPQDHNGVKMIFPLATSTPSSGCQTFPCEDCYNLPDDIATKVTHGDDLVCLVGNLATTRRGLGARMSHDFVTSEAST